MEHTPLIPAVKSQNDRTVYIGKEPQEDTWSKPLFLKSLENNIAML